ncbi:uncharacterized protein JCM6883_003070 [Sporobolomyces salmoneus]|uniref:uncharacterized protein n=1 Tax=Sporobolomyces salmoneus TaxID=183962 RepID=UPI00317871D9
MEAKTQEKQQTSAVSQSESPTTSKQDASPSSQVTQQPKKEGQDLQTLLDQQLSTFESFFDRLNDSSFSQLDPLLSNDPLFSWQIRPLSLYPDVFTKSGLEYEKGEIGNVFRQMKEKLLKDVQDVEKSITQSENKLAVRMNQKGKDADNNDFEHSSAMFLGFESGTDKIVKGVQFFDSTTTRAQAERTGTKI